MTRKLIGVLTRFHFAALILVAAFVSVGRPVSAAPTGSELNGRVRAIEDYKTPGLEAELSGIYPHPSDDNLYYVLTNLKPPYRYGQKPMLPLKYRGKLLTVEKSTGRIVDAVKIADDDFGGLVFADGSFYAATTRGAEILKLDPKSFAVLARYRLPSPAGGLGYDRERGVLIAQLYVGHPHLAVVDVKTGAIKESLWSDESAMGLAKVDGDWLCTWASGWDPGSFSELRVLDPATGHVRQRLKLDGVHTAIAPDRGNKGEPAFISLMTVNSHTGETVIRKFAYAGQTQGTHAVAPHSDGDGGAKQSEMSDMAVARSAESAQFAKVAGAPDCVTAAVHRGNPKEGASTMLFRATNGCVIPWHWHSADEQWMIVSGTARVEMKGQRAVALKAGGFVFTPARHVHQFSCSGSCVLFRTINAALDIHYVDEGGNEITLDQALKGRRR